MNAFRRLANWLDGLDAPRRNTVRSYLNDIDRAVENGIRILEIPLFGETKAQREVRQQVLGQLRGWHRALNDEGGVCDGPATVVSDQGQHGFQQCQRTPGQTSCRACPTPGV